MKEVKITSKIFKFLLKGGLKFNPGIPGRASPCTGLIKTYTIMLYNNAVFQLIYFKIITIIFFLLWARLECIAIVNFDLVCVFDAIAFCHIFLAKICRSHQQCSNSKFMTKLLSRGVNASHLKIYSWIRL